MAPTATRIKHDAIDPFSRGAIAPSVAFARGVAPLRAFMLRQARVADVALFERIAHERDAGACTGGDHRNQAGADRYCHRHMRCDDQGGHDEDAAAQTGESSDESGAECEGDEPHQNFKHRLLPAR